jgi:RNA polymerase sigma-70 factor (ECF subfamily)
MVGLAATFLSAVGDPERYTRDDLDTALTAVLARVRAAWPGVDIADDEFVRHLAKHLPELDADRAVDLYLAHACSTGADSALRAFETHVVPIARLALARFRYGDAFVADALQELRVRLLVGTPPRIAAYAGAGSLAAWIKVSAVRVAINLRNRDRRHTPTDDEPFVEEALVDPELEVIRRRHQGDVEAAVRDEFRALAADDRLLLRFYMLDGLNIAEIGKIIGVSRATVGRRVVDVRARLLDGTRARLLRTLAISDSTLDSLLRIVRDHLDLTLSHLLASSER